MHLCSNTCDACFVYNDCFVIVFYECMRFYDSMQYLLLLLLLPTLRFHRAQFSKFVQACFCFCFWSVGMSFMVVLGVLCVCVPKNVSFWMVRDFRPSLSEIPQNERHSRMRSSHRDGFNFTPSMQNSNSFQHNSGTSWK